MPFRRDLLRVERLRIESVYHSAYNYVSLKGLLAERWAHGPHFGSFNDQGGQVTLGPGEPVEGERPTLGDRLTAVYGIKASALEQLQIQDQAATIELAVQWHEDVFAVLVPKRVVGLNAAWFGLYPMSEERLRDRFERTFYREGTMRKLVPDRYGSFFTTAEGIAREGDDTLSFAAGAIGRFNSAYFLPADAERDQRTWLGIRVDLRRHTEDGIQNPADQIAPFVQASEADFEHLAASTIQRLVD